MPHKALTIIRWLITIGLLVVIPVAAWAYFDLPPLPPPEEYGNLLISRGTKAKGVKPVFFSHWSHRTLYTCRVCHTELEFNMEVNSTEITEDASRKGRFCGACHNGKTAFGHLKNCERCHTGEINSNSDKFSIFTRFDFPRTDYGNRIDWVEAMKVRLIFPNRYLKTKSQDIQFDKKLSLDAEWNMIPPSIFPHRAHTAWLDCNNCHPEIFNIKRKGTKFTMAKILKGEYCGVCHVNVAFPMDDCKRCHPGIRKGI
jgi:c(7)-type cytochrome triheme protein